MSITKIRRLKLFRKIIDICSENYVNYMNSAGYAVAQLINALRYKPKGRGFDSRRSI